MQASLLHSAVSRIITSISCLSRALFNFIIVTEKHDSFKSSYLCVYIIIIIMSDRGQILEGLQTNLVERVAPMRALFS